MLHALATYRDRLRCSGGLALDRFRLGVLESVADIAALMTKDRYADALNQR